MIRALEGYWADYGCVLMQPYHTELAAGTMNPATFLRSLGPDKWKTAYVEPIAVGDPLPDMALFLDAVPGCYLFVGGANSERGLASPHHSPTFDFDEDALDVGVQTLAGAALEFLNGG